MFLWKRQIKWSNTICNNTLRRANTTLHSTVQVWHKLHSHFTWTSSLNATTWPNCTWIKIQSTTDVFNEGPGCNFKGCAVLTWNSKVLCWNSLFIAKCSYTWLHSLCHKESTLAQEKENCILISLWCHSSHTKTKRSRGIPDHRQNLPMRKECLLEVPAFCQTVKDGILCLGYCHSVSHNNYLSSPLFTAGLCHY